MDSTAGRQSYSTIRQSSASTLPSEPNTRKTTHHDEPRNSIKPIYNLSQSSVKQRSETGAADPPRQTSSSASSSSSPSESLLDLSKETSVTWHVFSGSETSSGYSTDSQNFDSASMMSSAKRIRLTRSASSPLATVNEQQYHSSGKSKNTIGSRHVTSHHHLPAIVVSQSLSPIPDRDDDDDDSYLTSAADLQKDMLQSRNSHILGALKIHPKLGQKVDLVTRQAPQRVEMVSNHKRSSDEGDQMRTTSNCHPQIRTPAEVKKPFSARNTSSPHHCYENSSQEGDDDEDHSSGGSSAEHVLMADECSQTYGALVSSTTPTTRKSINTRKSPPRGGYNEEDSSSHSSSSSTSTEYKSSAAAGPKPTSAAQFKTGTALEVTSRKSRQVAGTVDSLKRYQLLDLTMRTAHLLRNSSMIQKQLDQLRAEVSHLMEGIPVSGN